MNNSQNPADLLIPYVDGELTGEQLIAFEIVLRQNDTLQGELENLMLSKKIIEHYGIQQQVAMVHRRMVSQGAKSRVVSMNYILRIAAIFVVCVLAFSTYKYISLSSSDILSDGELSYTLNTERGTAKSSGIEKAYRQQDYRSVIHEFESKAHPDAMEQFLAAQAYRAVHLPAEAIAILKSLTGTASALNYQDDIEYYLGLSYLENNQPSAAKGWLDKIYANKDHLYHDRVDDLTLLKLKLYILKTGK